MRNDSDWKTIKYYFRDKERIAKVGVVWAPQQGWFYWFSFPKRPPIYFKKDDSGVWIRQGFEFMPDGLFEVLTSAIDEQIIPLYTKK